MKLLICVECGDVFNLTTKIKECSCKKSKGAYEEDKLHAWYSGPCKPLGFANSGFYQALANQPQESWGKEFTAFVIQKDCSTFINKDL